MLYLSKGGNCNLGAGIVAVRTDCSILLSLYNKCGPVLNQCMPHVHKGRGGAGAYNTRGSFFFAIHYQKCSLLGWKSLSARDRVLHISNHPTSSMRSFFLLVPLAFSHLNAHFVQIQDEPFTREAKVQLIACPIVAANTRGVFYGLFFFFNTHTSDLYLWWPAHPSTSHFRLTKSILVYKILFFLFYSVKHEMILNVTQCHRSLKLVGFGGEERGLPLCGNYTFCTTNLCKICWD